MATVTTRGKARKNTQESTKNAAGDPQNELERRFDDVETRVGSLQKEVENLRQILSDKEETIDCLVHERDEVYDELYKLRLKLADAWDINPILGDVWHVRWLGGGEGNLPTPVIC